MDMDIDDVGVVGTVSDYISDARRLAAPPSEAVLQPAAGMQRRAAVYRNAFVVDTNFLLVRLALLRELVAACAAGDVAVVVPLAVLHELDVLKSGSGGGDDDDKSQSVAALARRAVNFVYGAFKAGNPGLVGQMAHQRLDPALRHDQAILDCCRYLSLQESKFVVLLTNDRNLANQAMAEKIAIVRDSADARHLDQLIGGLQPAFEAWSAANVPAGLDEQMEVDAHDDSPYREGAQELIRPASTRDLNTGTAVATQDAMPTSAESAIYTDNSRLRAKLQDMESVLLQVLPGHIRRHLMAVHGDSESVDYLLKPYTFDTLRDIAHALKASAIGTFNSRIRDMKNRWTELVQSAMTFDAWISRAFDDTPFLHRRELQGFVALWRSVAAGLLSDGESTALRRAIGTDMSKSSSADDKSRLEAVLHVD